MSDSLYPVYTGNPISNTLSLSKALGLDEAELILVANNSSKYWRRGKTQKKKDGTQRLTHNSVDPLKKIQRKIKIVFLERIKYPNFVLGGVASDSFQSRGYIVNANLHTGKKILFSEDIENFFPSTTSAMIENIWKRLFKFHPDVAKLLTQLTTYQDCLPQGWVTSNHLANLALWRLEANTVNILSAKGYTYSRFVDDIVVSSEKSIVKSEKSYVVKLLTELISHSGYRVKRTKHSIATKSGSPDKKRKMCVGNLNVNTHRVTVPKRRRANIRTAVFVCESWEPRLKDSEEYRTQWHHASGLVASIKRFHPDEEKKLRGRLEMVKPAESPSASTSHKA